MYFVSNLIFHFKFVCSTSAMLENMTNFIPLNFAESHTSLFSMLLTVIRLGFWKVFFSGCGGEVSLTPSHVSRRTNLIPIELRLKVKKCWHHLLYVDVIRYFARRKWVCYEIQNYVWRKIDTLKVSQK